MSADKYSPGEKRGLGSKYVLREVDGKEIRMSARLAAKAAEVPDDLSAILGGYSGGGGRRGKMRGGGRLEVVTAFAARVTEGLAASALAGKAVNLGLASAAIASEGAATVSGKLGDAVGDTLGGIGNTFRTAIQLIVLGIGMYRAVVGTIGSTIGNIGKAAERAEVMLTSPGNQKEVADAITSDAPTAIAISILALTQAGIVSLSTVVAIVLRAVGTGLTGGARAAATVGFYTWYVTQTKDKQDGIKAAATKTAKELTVAAGTAVATAGDAAKSLAVLIAEGIVKAREAAAAPPAAEPVPAAEAAAVDLANAGEAVLQAETAAAAVVLVAAVKDKRRGARQPPTAPPPSPAGAPASPGPDPSADLVAEVADAPRVPSDEADASGPAVEPATRTRAARARRGEPAAGRGGRRKTKKAKKSKRRMTRRQTAPMFAY